MATDQDPGGTVVHEVRWADYGVPDPSVLVARLDPAVLVVFDVVARPPAATEGPG